MKKLLLLSIFSFAIFILHAQVNPSATYQQYLLQKRGYKQQQPIAVTKLLPQKLFSLNNNNENNNDKNIDNMPIAGNGSLNLAFIENNNNGLDIFQSTPDNIYVAKPDATFSSNMPSVTFKVITPSIKARP